MARIILTTVLIVLLNVLVGCHDADSGRGQLLPESIRTSSSRAAVTKVAADKETDIVEQMSFHRRAYRQYLESLIKHYKKTGSYMKRGWAEKELAALDTIPQYDYIIEAGVAGPDLRATEAIDEADELYYEALVLEEEARKMVIIKNKELLRLVLDKFNQLIRKYPSSDKIDDAAFKAGRIYEGFKDYSIALLYYQRTYQWDSETIYPARYRAAYVLDRRMHRRAEALELYQQALKYDSLSDAQRKFAEERITKFTHSAETAK